MENDGEKIRNEFNLHDLAPDHFPLYAILKNTADTRQLILKAVETGDQATIQRMIQKDNFFSGLNRGFFAVWRSVAELKDLSLRFFLDLSEASVRGGFDPEEAETLFVELASRLAKVATFDELIKLQKLGVTTYSDPLFRKSAKKHISLADRVNRFIQENFMHKLTIAQISNALYLHPNYLMKKYKIESGKSIMQAVNDKRVFEAVNLLRTTRISIEQISKKTGFETPQYFNAVFKKRTGKSPNQVRRESQKRADDFSKELPRQEGNPEQSFSQF